MSFGLTNGPTTFMDLMNSVFQSYLDFFIIVFIEDILVYSKNEGEHMDNLRVVLQVLKEYQLFDRYRKCEFCLRLVEFPGHIISREGVEVDPRKTEAVKKWPRPLTPIDVSSFLGLAGCHRRLMDDFASIASALTI